MMLYSFFFFFNDTATTEIYTLSLHDALPILFCKTTPVRTSPAVELGSMTTWSGQPEPACSGKAGLPRSLNMDASSALRSEEHTSELQSRQYLVCRLLLEKKNNKTIIR